MLKDIYDVKSLCRAVKLHHSVYYYHKQNRENSYKKANEELDKNIKEEYEKSADIRDKIKHLQKCNE